MEILNLKSTITEIKISLAGLDGKFKLTEKKKNQKTQISIDVAIQRTDRKKKKNNEQT